MSRAQDRTLQTILTSVNLPTLPVVASKILDLTAQEDVPITDVIALITQDIALSAKILKIANSAFYNFPQQISSVQQAVCLLGINAVRCLVLSFSFLTMGQEKPCPHFDFNTFWRRSLVAAAAARLLAERSGQIDPEEMFTLGLLQNIGQLILALTLPARYGQFLERLQATDDTPVVALEEEFLGLAHTISGAEVARAWGLPDSILAILRFHHSPFQYSDSNPQVALALKIVYLSDLVAQIFTSTTPLVAHQQFREQAQQLLVLSPDSVETIFRHLNRDIEHTARFFGLTVAPVRSVDEIILEANIRLSLLHLSYEEMHQELQQAKSTLEKLRNQLAERNQLLEQLANLDGLTEIHNHRSFQTFLHAEINRALHSHNPISLLLGDIDHFKQFNDTHGHQIGDFILKELCLLVLPILRQYDLMARYGGEEFVFVLPETDLNGARTVAEKIRRTVAEHDFFDGTRHYRVTLSIGVATAHPTSNDFQKNALIDQADQALYQAKNRGRNCVSVSSPLARPAWLPR
jgi:diguanylate cyclase (GGDEF)-like protein